MNSGIEAESICLEAQGLDYCHGPNNFATQKLGQDACAACLSVAYVNVRAERDTAHYEARHDDMTDLANRRYLREYFEQHIAAGEPFGAIGMDLENFKHVNDSRGQGFGDQLIIDFANVLEAQTRLHDQVAARRGGDEFTILVTLQADPKRALRADYMPSAKSAEERLDVISGRISKELHRIPNVVKYNATTPKGKKLGVRYRSSLWVPGMDLKELLVASDPKDPTANE